MFTFASVAVMPFYSNFVPMLIRRALKRPQYDDPAVIVHASRAGYANRPPGCCSVFSGQLIVFCRHLVPLDFIYADSRAVCLAMDRCELFDEFVLPEKSFV